MHRQQEQNGKVFLRFQRRNWNSTVDFQCESRIFMLIEFKDFAT
jgi:hypothetical protein